MADKVMNFEVEPIDYIDDGKKRHAVSLEAGRSSQIARERKGASSIGIQDPDDYAKFLAESGVHPTDIEAHRARIADALQKLANGPATSNPDSTPAESKDTNR